MRETIRRLRSTFGLPGAPCKYGLVLSGGGARAAFQAGVLQYIADAIDVPAIPIITGVSAGSLNAAHIANDTDGFKASVSHLTQCWEILTSDDVYEAASGFDLFWSVIRKTGSHESGELVPRYGLVDTDPLRNFLKEKLQAPDGRLSGIEENIRNGTLDSCAFVTTNYATGRTVTWIEGTNLQGWERPRRISIRTALTVEHIMASSSLPFLFPAVQLGSAWYGDGGIRLAEPFSPAIHLGAGRILAISTRYGRTVEEAADPAILGYPPAAQIFGILLNSIFLDRLDQDAIMLSRINRLIREVPKRRRLGMRPIDLLVIRPSIDLGRLSGEFQTELKGILSIIARGLGSKDTKSPDWLSMILFDPVYSARLMEIGYDDARRQKQHLVRFFDASTPWNSG